MDAFTLTDYLLSAILGVLLFMVVIKASDRFFPVILGFVCFSFGSLRAADEQDIVDAVGAANSAITSAVNSVGSNTATAAFYTALIQSAMSSLQYEITDQGYTLDNIYNTESMNSSYLYNIDYGVNSYVGPNVDSLVSQISSLNSTVTASKDYLQTLANESVYLGSIDDNTYQALGKIDNVEAAVQAVRVAIENCCYEEMAKLEAINANTDGIEALLADTNTVLDSILVQDQLQNTTLDNIKLDFETLLDQSLTANGLLGEIKGVLETNFSSVIGALQGMASADSLHYDGMNEQPVIETPEVPSPNPSLGEFEEGTPTTIAEVNEDQDIDGRLVDEWSDEIDDDGITTLNDSIGFDLVGSKFAGINTGSSDPSLDGLDVETLAFASGAGFDDFDFLAAVQPYWLQIQPIIAMLLTALIFWHMGKYFFTHAAKALAS